VVQRVFQLRGELLLRQHAIRSVLALRDEVAVRGHVRIKRHLIRAVAAPPEAMAVPRLVHRNAVDPRAEAGLPTETLNGAEDAQEDVLREIECLVAVAEQVDGQLDDHPFVLS